MKVATYYGVQDLWKNKKKTTTVTGYFDLLRLVKTLSPNDTVWISFWEGMHRHAAIIMTLLVLVAVLLQSHSLHKDSGGLSDR